MKKVIKIGLVISLLGIVITLGWLRAENGKTETVTGESQEIKLPTPQYKSTVSVEEALLQRRSIRQYAPGALTLNEVSQLLWAAQGTTKKDFFRTAPSAGATYPIDTYLVAGDVEGLPAGIYQYQPQGHRLTPKITGDKRKELSQAAANQPWVLKAPISIVLVSIQERITSRYGPRSIRYIFMEAGHIGQNVHIQCETLGLGTVMIGAYSDKAAREVIGVEQEVIYMMPIGKKKK